MKEENERKQDPEGSIEPDIRGDVSNVTNKLAGKKNQEPEGSKALKEPEGSKAQDVGKDASKAKKIESKTNQLPDNLKVSDIDYSGILDTSTNSAVNLPRFENLAKTPENKGPDKKRVASDKNKNNKNKGKGKDPNYRYSI